MKYLNILCIATSMALIVSNAHAEKNKDELLKLGSPEEVGQAIAVESNSRGVGFVDQRSVMKMTLKNAYGAENSRNMRIRTFERPALDVGDKSIIIFDSPRDVKGTALLSHAEILKQDSQWLYLPSLKRIKRISSNNKSGPFMGSEFAYEDITANEIGKYSWKFLDVEPCPNMPSLECFKLETRPKYKYSGYTKRIVWMDVEEFRGQQIDFYDRKDSLMKTQTFSGYKEYLGKFWRADKWSIVNLQTNKKTDIELTSYKFKTGLTDANFNQATLKRVK